MAGLHMRTRRVPRSRSAHSLGSAQESDSSSRRIAAGLATLLDALDVVTQELSHDANDHAAVLSFVCQQAAKLFPAAAYALYTKEPRQAGLHLVAASSQTFPFPPTWPPELLRVAEGRQVPMFDVEINAALDAPGTTSSVRRVAVFAVPTPLQGGSPLCIL